MGESRCTNRSSSCRSSSTATTTFGTRRRYFQGDIAVKAISCIPTNLIWPSRTRYCAVCRIIAGGGIVRTPTVVALCKRKSIVLDAKVVTKTVGLKLAVVWRANGLVFASTRRRTVLTTAHAGSIDVGAVFNVV